MIPDVEPIGLFVTRMARTMSRAFDRALAAAGGSLPAWQVLVSLKGPAHGTQRHLADALGIEGATLTHHLNRMERTGLVTRERDPANRRAHLVALTAAGEQAFHRLLGPVQSFDRQLRAGFTDDELDTLRQLLERVAANASAASADAAASSAGVPAPASRPTAAGSGDGPRSKEPT
jgi:MarR family transcriptional regulator for hemolysin